MSNSAWVLDNEPRILTIVKAKTLSKLKTKYSDIDELTYTTIDQVNVTNNKSHSIYIHELNGVENANSRDLSCRGINAYLSTFEVRISVLQSETQDKKGDARYIAKIILDAFSSLGFEATSTPIITLSNNVYTVNMRVRRLIAQGDKF